MTFPISSNDHNRLDVLLDSVLEAYAQGEIDLLTARSLLAHVFTAAAIDNESEVRAWLDPKQQARWLEEAKRGKRSA